MQSAAGPRLHDSRACAHQGFKAIFLGVGLPKGRKLDLPGADLAGVYDGMDFLRAFNEGNPLPVGNRIIVIGGGNVAYDVARSAVRPLELWDQYQTRSADMADAESRWPTTWPAPPMRMSGEKRSPRGLPRKSSEMPADEIEVTEGAEEGLVLHNSRGPREIVGHDGKVADCAPWSALRSSIRAAASTPASMSRTSKYIPADTIIFSIGQSSDLSFLQPGDGVESNRGLIKVDPETYQTTAPDVFACGDIAHGPRLFINAIRSAQIAARSMHDYLRGTRTEETIRSPGRRPPTPCAKAGTSCAVITRRL